MNSEVARRLVQLRELQDVDPPRERPLSEYFCMVTLQLKMTHLASCKSIRVRQDGGTRMPVVRTTLRETVAGGTLVNFDIGCDCAFAHLVAVRVL